MELEQDFDLHRNREWRLESECECECECGNLIFYGGVWAVGVIIHN